MWKKGITKQLLCSGGLGTDETTLIEGVEPSSFGAAGNSSFSTACRGDPHETRKVLKDYACKKKECENLSSKHCRISELFWLWRMNFRSEVSFRASRPIEALIWTSIAELKTSITITGTELQTKLVVLDS